MNDEGPILSAGPSSLLFLLAGQGSRLTGDVTVDPLALGEACILELQYVQTNTPPLTAYHYPTPLSID